MKFETPTSTRPRHHVCHSHGEVFVHRRRRRDDLYLGHYDVSTPNARLTRDNTHRRPHLRADLTKERRGDYLVNRPVSPTSTN